jgi:hypothetical protein
MFNDTITASESRQALDELRSRGVATVEIQFSGGNDEGGTDGIAFLDADGNEVEAPPSPNVYTVYTAGGGTEIRAGGWQESRAATAEEIRQHNVYRVLEQPIYDRYYTFAGEFYVEGTVTWDIAKGTHEMHGQEQVSSWESF